MAPMTNQIEEAATVSDSVETIPATGNATLLDEASKANKATMIPVKCRELDGTLTRVGFIWGDGMTYYKHAREKIQKELVPSLLDPAKRWFFVDPHCDMKVSDKQEAVVPIELWDEDPSGKDLPWLLIEVVQNI